MSRCIDMYTFVVKDIVFYKYLSNMTKVLLCLIILMGNLMITHSQEKKYISFEKKYSRARSSQISLSGRLSTPISRGISQPVLAFLNGKFLVIYFLPDLGKINITIMNSCNVIVYNNVVSFLDNMNLSIDMTNYPEGKYKIVFTDTEGYQLFGDFVI